MRRFLLHTSALIGYISFLGLGLGEAIRPTASQALPLESPSLLAQSGSSTRWPGNRTGGGTRGCEIIPGTPRSLSTLKRSFIALTPQTNLGITTQSYPRLAWYIPPSLVRYAELELMSEQDMLLYRATFRINGEGGIYSLALPSDASIPPLEVDEAYRWTLSLYCQSNEETLDPAFNFGLDLGRTSVSSYIYRQPVESAETPIRERSDEDWVAQVQGDLEQNLWVDALDKLLAQYCEGSDTSQFNEEWKNALDTIGLGELADEPIHLQCARPTPES
jgi:hypothetical protein